MGSSPYLEGVLLRLLPAPGLPGSHRDRSEVSFRKSCSGRGIDMLPGGRKDLHQKGRSFGVFARLIFIQEATEGGGVVIDNHICNQAAALIADLNVDIRFTGELFFPSYLSNCRSKLVIGLGLRFCERWTSRCNCGCIT